MKRWFLITILLYAVVVFMLAVPLAWVCFLPWHPSENPWEIFQIPITWIIGVFFVLSQALMLLVPVDQAKGRPRKRRKLLIPVIVSALLMAVLLVSVIVCGYLAIYGEKATPPIERLIDELDGLGIVLELAGMTVLSWIVWGLIFYRYLRSPNPDRVVSRTMAWLLGGSIMELLVAVPSHVIVRSRGDCCAPFATFCGICCGLCVMLLSFGPGVYFLFIRRVDLLRIKPLGHCHRCGYDLRAHPPGTRCPECGTLVPPLPDGTPTPAITSTRNAS